MNLHATALVVGDRGLLLTGASGAGKTTLALALLARAQAAGRFAALVSDDRVIARSVNGRLLCAPPATIAGLVEIRGRVPLATRHLPGAVVDLIVDLVPPDEAPRYAEPAFETLAGCSLPLLRLERRNVEGAMPALASWLSLPGFSA